MRIRATAAAAVVSGALALTGAALPSAQAATGAHPSVGALHRAFAAQHHHGGVSALAAPSETGDPGPMGSLNVTFSNVKVDTGHPFVSVGTANVVHVPYTYTLQATGIDVTSDDFLTGVDIYHGGSDETADTDLYGDAPATCKPTSITGTGATEVAVENCAGTVDVHPADGDLISVEAGPNYHAGALALVVPSEDPSATDYPTGMAYTEGFAAPGFQRYSKLTAHGSVASITKNHTLTVTGALTRANWDTNTYGGYTNQAVKLQFRKKGSTVYTTVKTVKTDGHGNLKTTATATTSGYWRYTFAATPTTPSATATGYYVAVK